MTESVSGLSMDSPVEFNGVNVGTVKSVEINKQNPHLIELLIDVKSSTPVTQATIATLNSRGVTGITYVALKDNGTDLRPLVIARGQRYPVIRSGPSLFMRLDIALKQLSKDFSKMTVTVQTLLDPQNQRAIKQTLQNIQKVTGVLAENSLRLNKILLNTEHATQQFTPLLQSSAGTMRLLETQTLPTAYHLLSNLDEVVQTLHDVSLNIKQNPTILIRGAAPPTLGPGESR